MPIPLRCWKQPGIERIGIYVSPRHRGRPRASNRVNVSGTAQLADKATSRTERAKHRLHNQIGRAHPVERGIAEDGVELTLEGERLTGGNPGIDASRSGTGDLRRAAVDTDDRASG